MGDQVVSKHLGVQLLPQNCGSPLAVVLAQVVYVLAQVLFGLITYSSVVFHDFRNSLRKSGVGFVLELHMFLGVKFGAIWLEKVVDFLEHVGCGRGIEPRNEVARAVCVLDFGFGLFEAEFKIIFTLFVHVLGFFYY